ncbi:hypothetical protein D030_4035B, partial [Vibrio parahaemolyticus AQ3810]
SFLLSGTFHAVYALYHRYLLGLQRLGSLHHRLQVL